MECNSEIVAITVSDEKPPGCYCSWVLTIPQDNIDLQREWKWERDREKESAYVYQAIA